MIWVGIDDTDTLDTRGTNQLAKQLAEVVRESFHCHRIVRHQLCSDPRIPCTSQNGSASLWFETRGTHSTTWLWEALHCTMLAEFVPGSDPGLCLTEHVPPSVVEFGERAQREIVTQQSARELAATTGIRLIGLGGTEGGVIGALAAVGLALHGNDGRVVYSDQWEGEWTGTVSCAELARIGVQVQTLAGELIREGTVHLPKKLRPNCRAGGIVLFAEPANSDLADWRALKII